MSNVEQGAVVGATGVAAPRAGGARAALVISLDFELAWGVHDSLGADGGYRANLLGAREAIPRMLEAFAAYDVAATWATVGFLFADGREELEAFSPELKPTYLDPRRDPYTIEVGDSERDDPLHFAPSLVRAVAEAPRQELASHTFSHYYCLEPGQTVEQFRADLEAAQAIAAHGGRRLRSLVLPRHQVRPDYFPAIAAAGFDVHRTHERNFLNQPHATGGTPLPIRALRMLDTYLPVSGANGVPWSDTRPGGGGLVDVRESRFLRPAVGRLAAAEPLRVGRIVSAMNAAAAHGEIFHLWWHPHNFGVDQELNLGNLRRILDAFVRLRDRGAMESLSMAEVADRAGGAASNGSRQRSHGELVGARSAT